jgi:hypothetical protein
VTDKPQLDEKSRIDDAQIKRSPANRPNISILTDGSNHSTKSEIKKNENPFISSSPTVSSPIPTTSSLNQTHLPSENTARRPIQRNATAHTGVSPTIVVFRRNKLIGISDHKHGRNVTISNHNRVHPVNGKQEESKEEEHEEKERAEEIDKLFEIDSESDPDD